MQLTRYTDYALRVLIYLAHEDDGLATIGEIAQAYRISENHLMKVVHGLAKLGYITTVRGKGGGMRLARPAAQINLGDVVRNMEETLHVVECLAAEYDGACCLAPSCRLKNVLQEAHAAFFNHLDAFTIADMIGKKPVFAPIQFHARAPHAAVAKPKAHRRA